MRESLLSNSKGALCLFTLGFLGMKSINTHLDYLANFAEEKEYQRFAFGLHPFCMTNNFESINLN